VYRPTFIKAAAKIQAYPSLEYPVERWRRSSLNIFGCSVLRSCISPIMIILRLV